jgi:Sulfotransferase domain
MSAHTIGGAMDEIKNFGERLLRAVSTRMFFAGKHVYQALRPLRSREPKRILFIFGCQRSGTTLLQEIFDQDLDAKVYGEFSAISRTRGKRHDIRLRALEEVKAIFERDRVGLIVAKPIVETQNARRLLAYFAGAKAVFIYRHYAAVASSNLKEFGKLNGIRNLRPIVNGESQNWRAEGVPQEIRSMVSARFREDMNPHDAAALFWYVRNRFFFDLGLDQESSIMPLRYEDLVREPATMIGGIYRFVGAHSSPAGATLVHGASAAKGKDVKLSPDIEALCRELLGRLDRAHERRWTGGSANALGPWALESR